MIFRQAVRAMTNSMPPSVPDYMTTPEFIQAAGYGTSSGQTVTAETAKLISTAYRCIDILCNDYAKMPLQTFSRPRPGIVQRVMPDSRIQNIPWLLEISPNRWQDPFIFQRMLMNWLLCWGNAYAWFPPADPGERKEIFVLSSQATTPVYDWLGNKWYMTTFINGEVAWLPEAEVTHLMINSVNGVYGRSVISYARESLGRQQGAYVVQGGMYEHGLNPSGILYINGVVTDPKAKQKLKESYAEALGGAGNAGGIAVFDNTVTKFEKVTLNPVDVQFLAGIEHTDIEIVNFFGLPAYKLNMGKEAYSSNEQKQLDYLNTTLDPYLIQTEQAARLKWLSLQEQNTMYFRFKRDILLQTDAKTRAEVHQIRINSGTESPNEAREDEDRSHESGLDIHLVPSNYAVVLPDGTIQPLSQPVREPQPAGGK
jgi:HK97 family phage portal protein